MKRSPYLLLLLPLPLALLLPAVALLTQELSLFLLFAWLFTYLAPAVCLLDSLFCARAGGAALLAWLAPPTSFAIGWLMVSLGLPGISLALSYLLSLLGAATGQEWHRRKGAA